MQKTIKFFSFSLIILLCNLGTANSFIPEHEKGILGLPYSQSEAFYIGGMHTNEALTLTLGAYPIKNWGFEYGVSSHTWHTSNAITKVDRYANTTEFWDGHEYDIRLRDIETENVRDYSIIYSQFILTHRQYKLVTNQIVLTGTESGSMLGHFEYKGQVTNIGLIASQVLIPPFRVGLVVYPVFVPFESSYEYEITDSTTDLGNGDDEAIVRQIDDNLRRKHNLTTFVLKLGFAF